MLPGTCWSVTGYGSLLLDRVFARCSSAAWQVRVNLPGEESPKEIMADVKACLRHTRMVVVDGCPDVYLLSDALLLIDEIQSMVDRRR